VQGGKFESWNSFYALKRGGSGPPSKGVRRGGGREREKKAPSLLGKGKNWREEEKTRKKEKRQKKKKPPPLGPVKNGSVKAGKKKGEKRTRKKKKTRKHVHHMRGKKENGVRTRRGNTASAIVTES